MQNESLENHNIFLENYSYSEKFLLLSVSYSKVGHIFDVELKGTLDILSV